MKFYTALEIAQLLRCSLSNVYKLLKAGELPSHHVGMRKGLRVSEGDLQSYLQGVRRIKQPSGPQRPARSYCPQNF